MYSPFKYPTRTPATGPWKGMSEIETAALEARTARMSGGFTPSIETQVGTI